MILRRLASDRTGAGSVEFALVAPVFLLFLTGIMEYCRVVWTMQTLNSVAFAAARCATYSANCATTTAVQAFAVSQAAANGLAIQSANVTYTSNTTCNGNGGQNQVQVSYTYQSALAALVPAFPSSLSGKACFSYVAPSGS